MTQMAPPPPPVFPQPAPVPASAPRRSAWPTAIGVISIVLGGLGLVCISVSVTWNAMQFRMPNQMAQEMPFVMPDWFLTYQTVAGLLQMVVSILLLVAGILLLRRRPAAGWLHLLYAVLGLTLAIVGAIVTYHAMEEVSASFEQSEGLEDMPPFVRAMMTSQMRSGSIMGVIFAAAYPAFLLVWFLRGPIRREIASWRVAPSAPTLHPPTM